MGLVFASAFLPVSFVFAANSCECFCGDVELGAFSIGAQNSGNECTQACSEVVSSKKVLYVGCFTDEAMYPENSNLCWTEAECIAYPVNIGTDTYQGAWGGQSAYCSQQSMTGAQMGYCYGPLIPVTLNVPILGVTEVGSVGDYINIIYRYAIPLAGLFGALMFTLAGFQYMTAGGDKGAVSKAKDRMKNTVIGIILLMSVYTIAYLIDPRFTRFNQLRPPLVKEAVLVDDATTCESLIRYGFDIDWTSGFCGEKGKITGDDSVDLNIVNAPEVGDTCMFSGCDDKSKTCVIKGDNSGGTCVSCDEISSMNDSLGITPTASVCSQIATRAQSQDTNPDHVYSCYFDDDFSDFSEADAIGADECVEFYTGGKEYIDCNALEDKITHSYDGCGAYEYVNAKSYLQSTDGQVSEFFGYGSADKIADIKNQFASICEQDVCDLADKGTISQGSCNMVDVSLIMSIFTDSIECIGTQTLADDE